MGLRWDGGAFQTDKQHLERLWSNKEVGTGLWDMGENVGQVEGYTGYGLHFDLMLRAVGSHCRVFCCKVKLMSEVSSWLTNLRLSTWLMDLFKIHQRDTTCRCNPEARIQSSEPWNSLSICSLWRPADLCVGFSAFGFSLQGWNYPGLDCGSYFSVLCWTYQGGYKGNQEVMLYAQDSSPSEEVGNRALQNLGLCLTTSLRARLPESCVYSHFHPLSLVVQGCLAVTGSHSEGPRTRWGYSNGIRLWNAVRWRCFTSLLPFEYLNNPVSEEG